MPSIDEVILTFASAPPEEKNTHKIRMKLDVVERIFGTETLTDIQRSKLDVILNSLNRQFIQAEKWERLETRAREQRGEPTTDDVLVDIIHWRDGNFPKEKVCKVQQTDNFIIPENYLIDINIVSRSYKKFNGVLFEYFTLAAYAECFNLDSKAKRFPKFIKNGQIKFVYFLNQIRPDINDQIALEHFGIKNYRGQKYRVENANSPSIIFKNEVARIINMKNIL